MASLASLTFTLLMIALGTPSMAQAASGPANLWIDTNGGTCTRQATPVAYADAQACSGIVAALSAAAAGDTVRIRPGSYGSATITQAKKSPAVSFIGDGTATTSVGEIRTKTGSGGLVFQDLAMSGYYNEQHTDDVTYRNAVINGNFYIRGSSNILWDHVEARIPSGTTTSSNFISSNYASSGALGSQNITIRDSYIHHYRRAAGSSDHVDCIAADDVDGLLIERTRFEDCEAVSIIFGKDNGTGRGARNVTLQNNIFNMASNGSSGYYNVCFTKMEGPAVLRFNSFDGKGVAECELLSTRGSVRMDSNVGLSNSSGNCSNSLFTWTRNVYPASPCAGGVTANPNYVNSAGGDFNLRAGSAAIDAGSSSYPPLDFSGSARFAGTAADAGALESGAGSAPAGPDTSLTSAPSGATTSTSATLAFTANPATSTFQCRIDGGAWTTCASPVIYNGLAVGAHSFDVRAIDLSGAIDATPATASWTVTAPVDTTPPNTTITSAPSGSITATSASLVFSATESATFECRMDGGSWTACTSPKAYSGLALGAHTFDVRATDLAGNVDLTPASAAWNVVAGADTTPPDTSIVSGPSGSTTSTSASLAFSATESATFECRMDGGSWAACTSPKAYSGLALGAHTFDVRATDAAGNTDLSPASRAWTVTAPADTTAPDTSITSGPSGSGTDASAALSFTATEAGSTFECRLDGGTWASCASPKSYSAMAVGSHTFDVRATDAAGNTDASPASRSWTVVAGTDTTPPERPLPA